MKITSIVLHTPDGDIELGDGKAQEATEEEVDEVLMAWDEILNNSRYFKFGQKNRGYFLPEKVLRNSYVEVFFVEEKECQDN